MVRRTRSSIRSHFIGPLLTFPRLRPIKLVRLLVRALPGVSGSPPGPRAAAPSPASKLLLAESASVRLSSLLSACKLFLDVLFLRRLPNPRIDLRDERPEGGVRVTSVVLNDDVDAMTDEPVSPPLPDVPPVSERLRKKEGVRRVAGLAGDPLLAKMRVTSELSSLVEFLSEESPVFALFSTA